MTWTPPTNIDQSVIDHYTVYVSSGSINNESSAISILRVPNCHDSGISIKVAAVTRFGCIGLNSSEVQPTLFMTNVQTQTTTDFSEALTTSEPAEAAISSK